MQLPICSQNVDFQNISLLILYGFLIKKLRDTEISIFHPSHEECTIKLPYMKENNFIALIS